MADDTGEDSTPPELEPEITERGARKALNFIYDVLNGRKDAAVFVWRDREGKLVETSSGKEVGVIFKVKEDPDAADTGNT